ncbi:MAG: TadE/TadG family type IV pilus assembly protein [Caulobacteraceae bacterium]
MLRLSRFPRDRSAATAVEFAIVLPAFLALTFGTVNVCIALYANTALHFAVDDAARCMSVRTTVCDNAADTQTYASSHYNGPNIAPTFVAASASCGNQVSATATYQLNAILTNVAVPLSATSCFPVQD